MPFIKLEVYEFALVEVDGEAVDLSTTGRFRITDTGNSPIKLEVKRCGKEEWEEPTSEDVDLFKKVAARYAE